MYFFRNLRFNLFATTALMLSVMLGTSGNLTIAQVVPDSTLGSQGSRVRRGATIRPNVRGILIDGGARRDRNLFHSLRELNVRQGQNVYFENPSGVENVLTRITGNTPSTIRGTLGVLGNANLFLLNPNGIIFGRGAKLDLTGSFIGTTATSLEFADGSDFSATSPEDVPLLTIEPPAALRFSTASQGIQLEDGALRVNQGRTLALVGDGIELQTGSLTAPNGRIELGSIAGRGSVQLNQDPDGFSLGYEDAPKFSDIRVSGAIQTRRNNLVIDPMLIRAPRGNITLQARNFDASLTRVSVTTFDRFDQDATGTLTINATGSVNLGNSSGLFARVAEGSQVQNTQEIRGITIDAADLTVNSGSEVTTSTSGRGDGGSLTIRATGVVEVNNGSLRSQVDQGARGNGGNLTIRASHLSVLNGGVISTSTTNSRHRFGNVRSRQIGNAGDIVIRAAEIEVRGNTDTDRASLISANINSPSRKFNRINAVNGGDIIINTENLSLQDGGIISSSVLNGARGRAGDLMIEGLRNGQPAELVEMSGVVRVSDRCCPAALLAQLEGGRGRGGSIIIRSRQVRLRERGQISTSSEGRGNAGNITILDADSVEVSGARNFIVDRIEEREGDGRTIFVDPVTFLGTALFSIVDDSGRGNSGTIRVQSQNLFIQTGGFITTANLGQGNAGRIIIRSQDVRVQDYGIITTDNSGQGNAGQIIIRSQDLRVQDNSSITTANSGQGNAGRINIRSRDLRVQDNSSITTANSGQGNAGRINIRSQDLRVQDNSSITTANSGQGDAGGIFIEALNSVKLIEGGELNASIAGGAELGSEQGGRIRVRTPFLFLDQGRIITETTAGDGGDIVLEGTTSGSFMDRLVLVNRSLISATAGTEEAGGDGGNVAIRTNSLLASGNSDIAANAFSGSGGAANVNALEQAFGIAGRDDRNRRTNDVTASSEQGSQGIVTFSTQPFVLESDLIELESVLADVPQVAQACEAAGRQSQLQLFVGRSTLPFDPGSETYSSSNPSPSTDVIEAQGWEPIGDGEFHFRAESPTPVTASPRPIISRCHVP